MKRLYLGVAVAQKEIIDDKGFRVKFVALPILHAAVNMDEAVGYGLRIIKEECPLKEGWFDHKVSMDEINITDMQGMLENGI